MACLTACSAFEPAPPEEVVAERAMRQATFLMAGDYEQALAFTVPSYQDSARAQLYGGKHAGASAWERVEVRWVRCGEDPEPNRCEVRLWIFGQFFSSGRFSSATGNSVPSSWDKTWVKLDGQWYQYLD